VGEGDYLRSIEWYRGGDMLSEDSASYSSPSTTRSSRYGHRSEVENMKQPAKLSSSGIRGGDMLSEDICIVFEPVDDTIFALWSS
jgi:hypothetical protein